MNKKKAIYLLKNSVAIIVMLALIIIVIYQNRNREIFDFTDKNKEAQEQSENKGVFDGFSGGQIKSVGKKIALITGDTLAVIDEKGEGVIRDITISSPVMHSEGNYIAYCGKNSKEAVVCKEDREYYSIETKDKILLIKVNKNGYLLLVTEKDGYSSEAIVYDRMGEAMFKWDLSTSELIDADISYDNKHVVLSVAAVNSKKMQGQLILIDMTTAEVEKKTGFDSELFYNVDFNHNGTYTAIGSDRLAYFNSNGTVKWSKTYDGRALIKADSSNPDVIALALASAGSNIKGNSTEVEIYDRLGKMLGKKTIDGYIDDITVRDDNVAAVIGKKIYVMNSKLKEIRTLTLETSVKKTEFFGDGESLFALGSSGGEIVR